MKTDAKAMQQFLDDREAADLPTPTAKQLDEAERLCSGMNAHLRSPLGIAMLALRLPVTRHDRRRLQAEIRHEIAMIRGDDTKSDKVRDELLENARARLADATLKPRRSRNQPPVAERDGIEAFLASNPGITDPVRAADEIAAMAGYAFPDGMIAPLKRVNRYLRSGRPGRIPTHIRAKMALVSAAALAAEVLADRPEATA